MSTLEISRFTFGQSVDESRVSQWLGSTIPANEVDAELMEDAAKRLRTAAIFNTPKAAEVMQLIEIAFRQRGNTPSPLIADEDDYHAAVSVVSEAAMRRVGVFDTYVKLTSLAANST